MGAGLEAAREFVLRHLSVEGVVAARAEHRFDHKTTLQELVQSHARQLPVYKTIASEGPAHELKFTVEVSFMGRRIGVGEGRSKRQAEQAAAETALRDKTQWLAEVLKPLPEPGDPLAE
jgi:ribonuclease III